MNIILHERCGLIGMALNPYVEEFLIIKFLRKNTLQWYNFKYWLFYFYK